MCALVGCLLTVTKMDLTILISIRWFWPACLGTIRTTCHCFPKFLYFQPNLSFVAGLLWLYPPPHSGTLSWSLTLLQVEDSHAVRLASSMDCCETSCRSQERGSAGRKVLQSSLYLPLTSTWDFCISQRYPGLHQGWDIWGSFFRHLYSLFARPSFHENNGVTTSASLKLFNRNPRSTPHPNTLHHCS